eukprot:1454200-Amphidinium_carterae.1
MVLCDWNSVWFQSRCGFSLACSDSSPARKPWTCWARWPRAMRSRLLAQCRLYCHLWVLGAPAAKVVLGAMNMLNVGQVVVTTLSLTMLSNVQHVERTLLSMRSPSKLQLRSQLQVQEARERRAAFSVLCSVSALQVWGFGIGHRAGDLPQPSAPPAAELVAPPAVAVPNDPSTASMDGLLKSC